MTSKATTTAVAETKMSQAELNQYKAEFDSFDSDGDGFIVETELTTVLKNLKMFKSADQVKQLIKEVDKNSNGKIEFNEFLDIIANVKAGKESNFTLVYTKQRDLIKVQTATGSHSFAEEEMAAFAEHISDALSADGDLKHLLPIKPQGLDLCKKVADGLLLCKFINVAVKGTIDERALNKRKNNKDLTLFQMQENQNLCIASAKGIGCKVTNIGASELLAGEKSPHIVLGLVWQLVKIALLNSINLKNHPALIRLLESGEELSDLLRLPPEQLLLRWFNYHLKNAGQKKISNFSGDVKDGNNYTYLLNQISSKTCSLDALKETDVNKRAAAVLDNASKLGVKCSVKARDIVSGNPRLNLLLAASIFNTNPGLEAVSEEETKKAGLMDDDVGDSREERVYRLWMNSLGIEDFYVNSLWEDCKDGITLLKVFDAIKPGVVDWSKTEKPPITSKFKKLHNTNYAITLGKSLKFSLVSIDGNDIVSGNKKLLLALVWQMMRFNTVELLSKLQAKKFAGKQITDDVLVQMANELVKNAGKSSTIKSFNDSTLASGVFFMDMLHAVEPKVIDWSFVKEGTNKEDGLDNCKYALSVARKLGASIFCVPEDLQEVKQKMVMTFIASLLALAK